MTNTAKKSHSLFDTGKVKHVSETAFTVRSGMLHTVNVVDGKLVCSCTWEKFNPGSESCSHVGAVKLHLAQFVATEAR